MKCWVVFIAMFWALGSGLHAEKAVTLEDFNCSDEILMDFRKMGTISEKDELSANDLKFLESLLNSEFPPCVMYASVILYKHNPEKYEDTLMDNYMINDYVDRDKNIWTEVDSRELENVMKTASTNLEDLDDKYGIELLYIFWYFRERNAWSSHERIEDKLSMARFARSYFFGMFFSDTDIDGLAILNKIDAIARKRYSD